MRVDREIKEKYFDESETSFEARKLWYAFKNAIFYENRFFVRHQLLDILSQYMEKNTLNIKSGQIYYRARIIEYAIINWCEFYCTSNPNAPFEEQMSEIRNSMAEFYMNAHGNNRAICYIKHTELMLKDWFDSTNSTNKWDILNN